MLKKNKREMVNKEEVDASFSGTNFGSDKPMDIVKWSLLEIASGYATGHTARMILNELGLLSTTMYPKLTKRGEYCLWCFFEDGYKKQ
jgi:hypothetical protein